MPRVTTLLLTGLGSAAAAALGAAGTDVDSTWYRTLDKPAWQPPPLAFPLVWTPLYVAIAYGTARMIDAEEEPATRRRLAGLAALDLAVNAGWCWTFFRARRPGAGLAVIAGLDALNVALVRAAGRRDPRARAALLPYAAWCGFATVLNAELWRRNR